MNKVQKPRKILKGVVTEVQQIMTEFNVAVLEEEAKIVAITKIVLNLMDQNGHYSSKSWSAILNLD
jgi:hypothetical protein